MKITNTDDPKAPLFLAAMSAWAGGLQLYIYWDGFAEWVRITGMSYQEVSATPYLPIWTSMRAVAGILFLVCSAVWFWRYIRLKRLKSQRLDPTPT